MRFEMKKGRTEEEDASVFIFSVFTFHFSTDAVRSTSFASLSSGCYVKKMPLPLPSPGVSSTTGSSSSSGIGPLLVSSCPVNEDLTLPWRDVKKPCDNSVNVNVNFNGKKPGGFDSTGDILMEVSTTTTKSTANNNGRQDEVFIDKIRMGSCGSCTGAVVSSTSMLTSTKPIQMQQVSSFNILDPPIRQNHVLPVPLFPSKYPGVTPGKHLVRQKILPPTTAEDEDDDNDNNNNGRKAKKMKSSKEETNNKKVAAAAPSTRLFYPSVFEQYAKPMRLHAPGELVSYLDVLIERAKSGSVYPKKGVTWTGPCVRVLLKVASLMKVNLDTLFAAIEVFDRFVVTFNDSLIAVIVDLGKTKKGLVQLSETQDRVRSQVTLRMASCLHLCHKLHSEPSTGDIGLQSIQRVLTSLSFSYTQSAIAKSELRVYKCLDHRIAYPTAWEMTTAILACIPDLNSVLRAKVTEQAACILLIAFENHSSLVEALWNIHISSNVNLPQLWKDPNNPALQKSTRFLHERKTWSVILYHDLTVILGGGALATAFTILTNMPQALTSPASTAESSSGNNVFSSLLQHRDMTKEIARFLKTPQMRVSDMSIAMLQIAVKATCS